VFNMFFGHEASCGVSIDSTAARPAAVRKKLNQIFEMFNHSTTR
jgi:hypothetical protein